MKRFPLRWLILFPILGALMFATTFVMKALPNVHLLALFMIVLTRVYRGWALIPIYLYIFAEGFLQGFGPFWIPYLYIWAVLWATIMLLPKKLNQRTAQILFCIAGFLHGALFGVLWAPFQALFFGLDLNGTLTWILAGLPFDLIHAVSNAVCCILAVPLITLFHRLEKRAS